MRRSPAFRAAVLLLAALFLGPPVFAAGGRIPQREPSLLAAVRHFLGSLVPSLAKGLSTIDPNGATAAGDTEGGWTIDPDG